MTSPCWKLPEITNIEQFIIDCSGKVDWRSDFMLGLVVLIFVAALLFGLVWMFGRIR